MFIVSAYPLTCLISQSLQRYPPSYHFPLGSRTIFWYKDWKVIPCIVSALLPVIKGRAVLVTEYCIEAKTWFSARIPNAFVVHAVIKLALLYLPSSNGKPLCW